MTSLLRAIVGALRSAIHDHGPITPEHVGSAAKRICGAVEHAAGPAAMARQRWQGVPEQDHAAVSASGGRAAWAGMSQEQRSEEMKRRARKRKARD